MARRISFREWADSLGDKQASKMLGMSFGGYSKLKRGLRMPSKATMDRIVELSGGRVSYESIISNYTGDPYEQNRRRS